MITFLLLSLISIIFLFVLQIASLENQLAKQRALVEKGEATRHNVEFEMTKVQRELSQTKQQSLQRESALQEVQDELKRMLFLVKLDLPLAHLFWSTYNVRESDSVTWTIYAFFFSGNNRVPYTTVITIVVIITTTIIRNIAIIATTIIIIITTNALFSSMVSYFLWSLVFVFVFLPLFHHFYTKNYMCIIYLYNHQQLDPFCRQNQWPKWWDQSLATEFTEI